MLYRYPTVGIGILSKVMHLHTSTSNTSNTSTGTGTVNLPTGTGTVLVQYEYWARLPCHYGVHVVQHHDRDLRSLLGSIGTHWYI